jgi:hypothetical protein
MKTCKQLAAEWEYWNVPLCSVQGRKAQRSNKGGKFRRMQRNRPMEELLRENI